MNLLFREAHGHEADLLHKLAMESKAYWGYDAAFMQACRKELSYADKLVRDDYQFRVLQGREKILGFYALQIIKPAEVEMEAMFIHPQFIGQGYGRRLLQHAVQLAGELGAKSILIQSDPNAQEFYLAAGAKALGWRESASIGGRQLPLLCLPVVESLN